MSASQKIILTIFVIYLALNAIIGIVFSKRQGSKQNVSSEKKFFIGGRNMNGLLLAMTTMATYTSVSSFISGPGAARAYLWICPGMDCHSAGSGYFFSFRCAW